MTKRARYWSELVQAWRQSGLSQAEFCRRRNIKSMTFAWWKRQLQKQAGDAPNRRGRPRQFVEVRLTSASSPRQARGMSLSNAVEPANPSFPAMYEVVLAHGRSIRIPLQFDPEALSRLIPVVESC